MKRCFSFEVKVLDNKYTFSLPSEDWKKHKHRQAKWETEIINNNHLNNYYKCENDWSSFFAPPVGTSDTRKWGTENVRWRQRAWTPFELQLFEEQQQQHERTLARNSLWTAGARRLFPSPGLHRLLTTAALGEETLASASSSSDSDTGGASPPPRKKHRASAAEGAGEPEASAGLPSATHLSRTGNNMQSNGTGQDQNHSTNSQNGESSTAGHANGLQANLNASGAQCGAGSGASGTTSGSLKKKKRLSQAEEDVIRLIGQHLHGLGLK